MSSTKALSLFRTLLPSWKFFAEVTEIPVLHYRIKNEGLEGPWLLGFHKPKPKWQILFLNPEGNLYMASNSLLQYFEDELEHGLDKSISIELISNLVRFNLNKQQFDPNTQFQFRIGKVFQGESSELGEELFVSEVMSLNA